MYCGRHGKGKQVAANAVPFSVLPLEVSIHVASREGTDIPTPPQFQPYVVCLKHESRICCSMLGGMKLHTSCSSLSSQFPLQPRPPIPKRGCARFSLIPEMDNEFYSRALEIQRMVSVPPADGKFNSISPLRNRALIRLRLS